MPGAELLARRVDALVALGLIHPPVAEALKGRHQAHETNRTGKLWFCLFPPRRARETGIGDFFRYWGGEAPYNSHDTDPVTSPILQALGTPCIVEADIPVTMLRQNFLPDKVARRFLVSRGMRTVEAIDHVDYARQPIPPSRIRRVLKFSEPDFVTLTCCNTWHRVLSA